MATPNANALARAGEQQIDPTTIFNVAVGGDLSALTPQQQLDYYQAVCRSLGLNPLTRPFGLLKLNNKTTLYALKDCTEQLRSTRRISIQIVSRETLEGVYVVTARATTPDGRNDEATGAVNLHGLKGEQLANAFMKAETKAKRRVTLSISGLGLLDESEAGSIAGVQQINVPVQIGNGIEAIDGVIIDGEQPKAKKSQPNQIKVQPAQIGLDQWQCSRATAMRLLNVCAELQKHGIDDEQMRQYLPDGVQSRKDLSEQQAVDLAEEFEAWLEVFTNGQAVEGEAING
jgi:hypothetical protein